jgi:hypothetical protein
VEAEVEHPGTYALAEQPLWASLDCTAGARRFDLGKASLALSCMDAAEAFVRTLPESSLPYALPYNSALALAFRLEIRTGDSLLPGFPAGLEAELELPPAGGTLYRFDPALNSVGGWLELDDMPAEGVLTLTQPGTYLLVP